MWGLSTSETIQMCIPLLISLLGWEGELLVVVQQLNLLAAPGFSHKTSSCILCLPISKQCDLCSEAIKGAQRKCRYQELQMKLSNVISIGTELAWLPLLSVCIAFILYLAPSSEKVISCLMPGDDYCQGWKAGTSWVEQKGAKPNQGSGQQMSCQVLVPLICDESFSRTWTVAISLNPH